METNKNPFSHLKTLSWLLMQSIETGKIEDLNKAAEILKEKNLNKLEIVHLILNAYQAGIKYAENSLRFKGGLR